MKLEIKKGMAVGPLIHSEMVLTQRDSSAPDFREEGLGERSVLLGVFVLSIVGGVSRVTEVTKAKDSNLFFHNRSCIRD